MKMQEDTESEEGLESIATKHQNYIKSLSPEQRDLIRERDDEYKTKGETHVERWDAFETEQKRRLNGLIPDGFHVQKIERTISMIKAIRDYETREQINLADYLDHQLE